MIVKFGVAAWVFMLKKLIQKLKRFSKAPKRIRLSHQGEHYHLGDLYDEINHKYFDGAADLQITWSGSKRSIPKTSLTFGTYCPNKKLIRIHRRLDQPHVPRYFIAFVIYHETLHHFYPPTYDRYGKRSIHHSQFKEAEKQFPHYKEAKLFAKSGFNPKINKIYS